MTWFSLSVPFFHPFILSFFRCLQYSSPTFYLLRKHLVMNLLEGNVRGESLGAGWVLCMSRARRPEEQFVCLSVCLFVCSTWFGYKGLE
jgi:hypothetical protein